MAFGAFAVQVLRGRWFALLGASLAVAAGGGGAYVFADYSSAVKASLGYNDKALRELGFWKNLGTSLGIFPGVINEVAPAWVVLVLGAAMNLVGYLMMYLGVSGGTARPPPWLMNAYVCVATNSQCFATTGALVSSVNNFPEDRGLVLGLLMGFSGLSGAILAQLHRAFCGAGDDGKALLLLLAWLPSAVFILFAPCIRIVPRRSGAAAGDEQRKGIMGFLGVSAAVGLYILVLNVVELKVSPFPRLAHHITAVVLVVVLLLLLPAAVAVVHERRQARVHVQPQPATTTAAHPTSTSSAAAASNDNDYTIMQAVCSMDMLLLLVSIACGAGGMLTATDNTDQIGQALGYKQDAISVLVSLTNLSNYAGRVVAGLASDSMLARYKQPRPLALAVTLLLACPAHLLIAFGVRGGLYIASLVLGFCIGALWTLVFATVSEVFGLAHFSALYNLTAVASPLGYYVLDVLVTGRLYDRQAQAHRQPLKQRTCIGVQCFMLSFEIIAGATLLGAMVSLVLTWRTRAFYRARFSAAAAVTTDSGSKMDELQIVTTGSGSKMDE
ncbi:unnamed protein product [Urochloa humidicola]